MDGRIRVFVTSCETGEGAWTAYEQKLRRLYELSDKRYRLTDDPDEADIILVGDPRGENRGRTILKNPIASRSPAKCFSLCDSDYPMFLHHGLYASSYRDWHSSGRVRTSAYVLQADYWGNPFTWSHVPSAPNSVDKQYLLTFIGRNSHRVRSALFALRFERHDIHVENSSTFDLWRATPAQKAERQKYYYEMLLRSKFSLCPRGEGTGTIRLFESMQLGVAPVIISDGWIFPCGPDWGAFSIVVKERHVRDLERIVQSHEASYAEMGLLARKAYEDHFSEPAYFNYVVGNCLEMLAEQRVPEIVYWKLAHVIDLTYTIRGRLRLRTRIRHLLSRRGS